MTADLRRRKLLSPEEKHIANRRMAIDAADADIDAAGKMSHLRGMKMAFTVNQYSPSAVVQRRMLMD